MERYVYNVLIGKDDPDVPGGVMWYLASSKEEVGPHIYDILNKLGGQGWEVIAVANIGFGAREDIILKKRVD